MELLLGASNCLDGMPRSTRVIGLFLSDCREAAVPFVTYLCGKPQAPIYRESSDPRLDERDMDKSLKGPGPDSVNRETKEKSHNP